MPYPTKRTPEVVEEILQRLSDGEPLAAICRSDKKFPHPNVWLRWVDDDEELAIAYARARDIGADAIAVQALEIIDAEPERVIELDDEGKQARSRIDSAAVTWARNRADLRLKLLAKWNPKKYGDKQTTELTGADGNAVQVEAKTTLSKDQLLELTKNLLANPQGE